MGDLVCHSSHLVKKGNLIPKNVVKNGELMDSRFVSLILSEGEGNDRERESRYIKHTDVLSSIPVNTNSQSRTNLDYLD